MRLLQQRTKRNCIAAKVQGETFQPDIFKNYIQYLWEGNTKHFSQRSAFISWKQSIYEYRKLKEIKSKSISKQ